MSEYSCLVDRLSNIGDLTDGDIELLKSLEKDQRSYQAGVTVREQGQIGRDLYVVSEGWAYSAVDMENGNRQILNIHMPGDMIGIGDLAFEHSMSSVITVTDAVLCPFPRSRLSDIFERSLRLATILFIVDTRQHALLVDRVIAIGQREAFQRISHLLLELCQRTLECTHNNIQDLVIPLTQQQIGEMLGLTSIHVNRTFKRLQDEQLVMVSRGKISVPDMGRLAEVADVQTAFAEIDLKWLKQAAED